MKREPAYIRIERHLRELLAHGGGIHEALPSEVVLAREFDVSVMTVRQAYSQLVNTGAVARVRFRGTFAAAHLTDDLVERLTGGNYLETWKMQAANVAAEVMSFDNRVAPDAIASHFGLPPGSPLSYLARRRRVNNQPVAWDIRWMPAVVAETLDAEVFQQLSVFAALAQVGLVAATSRSDITARAATADDCEMLECPPTEVLLEREVWGVDSEGEVLLTGTSLYPATRFSFRSTATLGNREGRAEEHHSD